MNKILAYDRKQDGEFIPNGYPFEKYFYDPNQYKNEYKLELTVRFFGSYPNFTKKLSEEINGEFLYLVEQFGSIEKLIGKESIYLECCFLNHIKKDTLTKIQNGLGKIVICAFEESRVDLDSILFLHTKLKKQNINKLYYITGNNWTIKKQYEIWCLRNNINPIIEVINSLEQMYLKGSDLYKSNNTFVQENEIELKREKRFLCFNRRIRPHRYSMISMFHHNNLLKNNLVSFSLERGKDLNHLGSDRKPDLHTMTQIMGKTLLRDKYISYYDELLKMSPQTIDYENLTNVMGPGCENKEPYLNTYFSIVTETAFNENTYFSTEKIYRPMLHFHPFIVYGSPFTLKNLRELGFKTFEGFINESYDEVLSPFKRMQKITKEIKRLCSMSDTEIHEWFLSMKDILIHNRNLMYQYGKQYNKNMEQILENIK